MGVFDPFFSVINTYTYAYLREDDTPYYIGKGTGKRVYDNYKRTVKCLKTKKSFISKKELN